MLTPQRAPHSSCLSRVLRTSGGLGRSHLAEAENCAVLSVDAARLIPQIPGPHRDRRVAFPRVRCAAGCG